MSIIKIGLDKMSIIAEYGTWNKKINVSDIILKFVVNDKVIIPKNTCLNDYFTDPCINKIKYLLLTYKNNRCIIKENAIYKDIVWNFMEEKSFECQYKIHIVYFVWINENVVWENIVCEQLIQLISTDLLNIANLYIHISVKSHLHDYVVGTISMLVPNAIIYTTIENEYEYRGIKLIWELGQKHPNDIFLYFHSKGMSHGIVNRCHCDKALFQTLIEPWKRVLTIFKIFEYINKVGASFNICGSPWFNFWWVRGSYLKDVEMPQLTSNRFYYEYWLANEMKIRSSNLIECYDMINNTNKLSHDPYQASYKLDSIIIP